mmetsp:Transcript_3496/g.10611  ORF Transcript_3496/g.10611 Transcript_3496/m.10611 type:complete len:147 (-) Transcript_3496:12-452(-)
MSGIQSDISEPIDDSKGGTLPWGKFQQNKKDTVIMHLPLPEGCSGRNVQVKITSKSLKAVIMGEERVAGDLCERVVADDSDWQLEDGHLVVTLQKQNEGWWDRVVAKDVPIDTSKFDDVPFVMGDMKEHELDSMRDMMGRMLGGAS